MYIIIANRLAEPPVNISTLICFPICGNFMFCQRDIEFISVRWRSILLLFIYVLFCSFHFRWKIPMSLFDWVSQPKSNICRESRFFSESLWATQVIFHKNSILKNFPLRFIRKLSTFAHIFKLINFDKWHGAWSIYCIQWTTTACTSIDCQSDGVVLDP